MTSDEFQISRICPGRDAPYLSVRCSGFCACAAAVIAFCFLVGCGSRETSEIPAALNFRDHGYLAARGSHTYVEGAGRGASGSSANALYYREYSDLMSHFGQYKPVLSPMVAPENDESCVIVDRSWSGDLLRQRFQCQNGDVEFQTAHPAENVVMVRILPSELRSSGITVGGCAADNGDGMLSSELVREGRNVVVQSRMDLFSFWGAVVAESLRTTVGIWCGLDGPPVSRGLLSDRDSGARPPEVYAGIDGLCWTAEIPAGVPTVVTFSFQRSWDDGSSSGNSELPEWTLVDSVGFDNAVRTVNSDIAAWFSEAPSAVSVLWEGTQAESGLQRSSPVSDSTAAASAMSWFLLWENTASAWGTGWTGEALVPSKRHYFRGVWLWDAAFNAVLLSRGNLNARLLGLKQLRLVIGNAAPDGRIPREIWAHDAGTGVQPPGVLAWAALALADATDLSASGGGSDGSMITGTSILAEFYEPLAAGHRWFVVNADSDGDGRCEWTKEDSGMDTSPRFDDGPVEAVDLQSWLALDATLLGEFARRLGKTGDAATWADEAAVRLADVHDNFWDPVDGIFYDRLTLADEPAPGVDSGYPEGDSMFDPFVRVRTPTAFIPLLVGAADTDQAAAMASHLADRSYFAAPYPIPTVPVTSDAYESGNYWRGPSWLVTNAFAVWGLERYGFSAVARDIRTATMNMVESSPTTWEYYDSTTGQGIGSPDFMWTGVFYLLLASGESPSFFRMDAID